MNDPLDADKPVTADSAPDSVTLSPSHPLTHSPIPGATRYMQAIRQLLNVVAADQGPAIAAAADAIVASLQAGGLLYLFGTGHSHMLAEEGHYRAGGLAPVVPVLASPVMLHESAVVSTRLERTPGVGAAVLSRYALSAADTIIIFSNSGVNAVPVEAALAAKQAGATVVAVVALDYAATVPAGPSGSKLADIADVVVDNHGVPGDALIALHDTGLRTGPASTISGAFILNAILTEVAWRLDSTATRAPIYISANMPGAQTHNVALVERYRTRNPHL
jgi:uncharacterized phosphosugar-binding protein